MRAIGLILMLALLALAVFFSMANRDIVALGLWPLDIRVAVPLFAPILGAVVIGFVLGWFGGWMKAGQARRQLRQAMRDGRDAAVEIDRLKAALKAAQSSETQSTSREVAA